jgi:predicted nucleic acid-binding protein
VAHLLDTDWIVSFLNGRPEAVEVVRELAADGIGLSIISYGEICEGLLRREPSDVLIRQFEGFASSVEIYAPNIETARRYASLRADLRSKGALIPDNDLWIASTAISYRLVLVTRDLHFSRVSGLDVYKSVERNK